MPYGLSGTGEASEPPRWSLKAYMRIPCEFPIPG
jgi:hypothetical protein